MSESPKILKEIEGVVECCPLCQVPFQDPISANIKQKCPSMEEGGCGKEFEVRIRG
jgi:hypothetical protein